MTRHKKWLENPLNRDIAKEATRQWKLRNRARVNSYQSARRYRLKTGGYTQAEWDALLVEWNGSCAYCGSPEALEADHVVPLSRGGVHNISNILPACQSCNREKYDRYVGEWLTLSRWNNV